jgi:hypothetical protein
MEIGVEKLSFWLQKDNVANQRENLILLLANMHMRLSPESDSPNKVTSSLSCGLIKIILNKVILMFRMLLFEIFS